MHAFRQLIEQGFDFVRPGNPDPRLQHFTGRYLALCRLPRLPGTCKWCFDKKTPGPRHYYCTNTCRLSAEIWCSPQGHWGSLWHFKRCQKACQTCGEVLGGMVAWNVDHIVAIANGGSGIGIDNIQVLCEPCHRRKTSEEKRLGYGNHKAKN